MHRRNFMKGLGMMGLGSMLPFSGMNQSDNPERKLSEDASPELVFFKNESNEFNFLMVLGGAHYKFSDIGELIEIRDLIDESNPASFVQSYLKFADSCKAIAEDCMKKGFTISARDAYLRASAYYFAATYYLDSSGQSERFPELFRIHRQCWKNAAEFMEFNYEEFSIPYEGTTLAGFFMSHKNDTSPRPLLIFNNGSDGSILDSWIFGGCGAFERGYNVMTFDGPGQGSSLFEKKLYFRYDWEKVITPVIDSVMKRDDVIKDKIVLIGVSQGGYWVPRAAAFEKRLKAVIADPGATNIEASWLSNLPSELVQLFKSGNKTEFNTFMKEGFRQSPELTALFNFRARPYGISDPYDVYKTTEQYNLFSVAEKIECPIIVTDPDDEVFFPGQSQQLYDMVKSPKQLIRFTTAEGANYHCEPKARMFWEQQVLDRLDEIIKA